MKPVPFEFVLDEIYELNPRTKPMFGCTAVYVGPLLVFVLRDREDHPEDNGVWIATDKEQHESLRRHFPMMRSIQLLGTDVTSWQVIPSSHPDFESSVVRACEMVKARDPRIGRVPKAKKPSLAAVDRKKQKAKKRTKRKA